MVSEKVSKFLTERTNDFKKKGEDWEKKNEQKVKELDDDVKDLRSHIDQVKAKLEETKLQLKAENEIAKARLCAEEKKAKELKDNELSEKAKNQAIIWIQRKLVALYPFKPSKKRGGMKKMMGMK